eukprot:Stramenopile-MAST_4_protein_4407
MEAITKKTVLRVFTSNIGRLLRLYGIAQDDIISYRVFDAFGSIFSGALFAYLGWSYRYTKKKAQPYQLIWSLVLTCGNILQIYRQLSKPCGVDCPLRFTVSEHELFSRQFKRFSVTPSQFKRLVDATTSWDKFEQGDIIVRKGEMMNKIFLIHGGEATCVDSEDSEEKCPSINFSAVPTKSNSHFIIGSSALLSWPSNKKAHQRSISASSPRGCEIISWEIKTLLLLMMEEKELERAFLDMYRRHRRPNRYHEQCRSSPEAKKLKANSGLKFSQNRALLTYEKMVTAVNKSINLPSPVQKQETRDFATRASIDSDQQEEILRRHGWTMGDWLDEEEFADDDKTSKLKTLSNYQTVDKDRPVVCIGGEKLTIENYSR